MSAFFITTGDQDGIGPEVTVKALSALKGTFKKTPVVWRSTNSKSFFSKLSGFYKRKIFSSSDEVIEFLHSTVAANKSFAKVSPNESFKALTSNNYLLEIESDKAPPFWVEESAKLCLKYPQYFSGLCTAPLSKTLIHDVGFKDLGHTEILARISKSKAVYQCYLGKSFNVLLVTAHVPVEKVSLLLTKKTVLGAIQAADKFFNSGNKGALSQRRPVQPFGFLGLNPHAGENGLIGKNERALSKFLADKAIQNIPIEGPLVPDAAFLEKNWSRYRCYIALYHDQGLIPFKMIHGKSSGAQITLGLPFLRTSVDHGTAKELFGKNIADPGSMMDAIKICDFGGANV